MPLSAASYFTILDLTSTLQQAKEYSTLTISINTVILKVSSIKKRLISEMLEQNEKSTKDNFELGTRSMLTHTTA